MAISAVNSSMVLAAAREPEMLAKAKAAGATGINIGGLCCTGNELLMRQLLAPVQALFDQAFLAARGLIG